MGPWGIAYLVCLVAVAALSVLFKQRSPSTATLILFMALGVTKLITYFEPQNEYVFDMACDFAAVMALLYFLKDILMVRVLILWYVGMTVCAYLFLASGAITEEQGHIRKDIFAFLQLLTIFSGAVYGRFFKPDNQLGDLGDANRGVNPSLPSSAPVHSQRFDEAGNFVVSGDI